MRLSKATPQGKQQSHSHYSNFDRTTLSSFDRTTTEDLKPEASKKGLGAKLPGPVWMWAAFLGVFGFQVILTRINVTVFGQGVLTIEDWIAKAEETAVARAGENFTNAMFAEAEEIAKVLAKLPDADLNTHVTTHLGTAVIQELEAAATANKANPQLLKAKALASQKPKEAKAIAGK